MSVAAENDTIALELADGVSVPVALFAGGTTGLVLLDRDGDWRAFWWKLGERAESDGLSALAFADCVPSDPAGAAVQAARLLERLGVEQVVIAAARGDAAAALRAAADGSLAAVVLVDPAVPDEELEPLLEQTPMPKLVLVIDDDVQAEAIYRHAVGPTVIRHLPAPDAVRRGAVPLSGETRDLAEEAILAFAIGVCGDGRRA
jgi:pimeloyl-ACP methyl ester carboxylesterase